MEILSPPLPSEPLFLYVAASKAAVSAALVQEVDGVRNRMLVSLRGGGGEFGKLKS
jgi:hypothetical protein